MGFSDPPTGDSLTIPDTATTDEPRIVIGPDLPVAIDHLAAALLFYAETDLGDLMVHYYGIGPGTVAGCVIERGFFPATAVDDSDTQVLDYYQYEPALANQPVFIMNAFRTIFEGLGFNQEVAIFIDYDISGDAASTLFWDGPVDISGPVELTGGATTDGVPVRGVQTGEALITHGAVASFTQAFVFPVAFANTPKVVCNIDSGAGATANWHVRAIGISTTGFTMFGFGPAVAWANVQCSYIAVES